MNRFRMLPNYRYYDNADGVITTRYEKPLRDYRIYGNSIQDGTPSPDNPKEIQSVGEKTYNLWGKETATAYEDNYGTLKYEWDDKGGIYFYNTSSVTKSCRTELAMLPGIYSVWMSTSGYIKKDGSLVKSGRFAIVSSTEEFILRVEVTTVSGSTKYLQALVVEGKYTEDTMPEFEPQGKYKIPIEVSNENGDTQNYNIFLDEPLRKCGKYIDYIDFKNAKIVRNVIYYNSIVDAKPSAEYQWGSGIQGNYGKTWGTCNIKAATDAAPMSNRFTGFVGGENISYDLPYHFQMSTTYKNCYCALPISIFAKHGGLTSEEFIDLEKADQTTLIDQYMIDNEVDLQGGRNIAIEELIDLHEIKICKGKSIIKVNTKIQPSAVSYQYYA